MRELVRGSRSASVGQWAGSHQNRSPGGGRGTGCSSWRYAPPPLRLQLAVLNAGSDLSGADWRASPNATHTRVCHALGIAREALGAKDRERLVLQGSLACVVASYCGRVAGSSQCLTAARGSGRLTHKGSVTLNGTLPTGWNIYVYAEAKTAHAGKGAFTIKDPIGSQRRVGATAQICASPPAPSQPCATGNGKASITVSGPGCPKPTNASSPSRGAPCGGRKCRTAPPKAGFSRVWRGRSG